MAPIASSAIADYRHVLVPLDGSARATCALPSARALAECFGADLHTISVTPSPDQAGGLRDHASTLLGSASSDDCVHVTVGDDPARAISAQVAALGSCLVCMATHGRGHVPEALIGSVARAVIAASREPVVTVGPASPSWTCEDPGLRPLAGELVACVDGGAASEGVLPVAAAWALRLGLGMTVVTVAEPSPPPLREGATWHRHHGPQVDAEAYMRALGGAWRTAAPSLRTAVVYDPLSAAEGIRVYGAAHPVGLLAVTTHARTGVRELVLGSGAADIIRVSPAPVLVVPLATI